MWVTLIIALLATQISEAKTASEYFPPPESEGGWRTLRDPDSIRRDAGITPRKMTFDDRASSSSPGPSR